MSDPPRAEAPWHEHASPDELRRTVDALYHIHRLISAMTSLDELLLRILEESRSVAGAEASSLLLFDPAKDELYFHVALGDSGNQERLKQAVRLKLGEGIAGAAAATRQSILVNDAHNDPRRFRAADELAAFHTRNLIAVPLLDRDQLVGVVEVLNKADGGDFTAMDMRVLEMFSALAAAAVTNARLIAELLDAERLAAIGEAVTALSHHTKNIVTGLASSAELIDMGLESGNAALLKKTWPVFKRSTKRITHFVQDMLSFSKHREPMREGCSLEDILNDAKQTYSEMIAQHKAELETEIGPLGGAIYADGDGLFRCLLNLIGNAADAVPQEGGRVRVCARLLEGDRIEVTVADNGPGVPDENKAKIFNTFFSTKGSRGTGLGLAVTQKIVHEHGGTIAVEDAPGGGALFRMVIPSGRLNRAQELGT